jgi:hypothetical protein
MKQTKQDKKRLELSRQKVRELTTDQLGDVAGGRVAPTDACATRVRKI